METEAGKILPLIPELSFLFSLRNASGQTAADLAQAHGFHDCFCIISNAQTQLVQLGVLRDCAPCGQGQHCRKRQLTQKENHHMKKARRAEGKKCDQLLELNEKNPT